MNKSKNSITTIVACATASGPSAISIVRLSGTDALQIALKLWQPVHKGPIKPRELTLGWLVDNEERIDQALLVYMPSPHSYTGEDTIELHLHGSPLITQKTIELALHNGAVQAKPGEFTKRAFLAGKIDLTQAEAVGELIASSNERLLRLASKQLSGELTKTISSIKKSLLTLVSHLSALLDFSEEDIVQHDNKKQQTTLEGIQEQLKDVLQSSHTLSTIRDGVQVSLVGLPNAGKSTLLNSLLGYNRSIVTAQKGTTRDTISETIVLGGINIVLTDTAGLRDSNNKAEKIGIKRSIQEIQNSDFVLVLIEPGMVTNTLHYLEKYQLNSVLHKENCMIIFTKTDLDHTPPILPASYKNFQTISISVKSKNGLDKLLIKLENNATQDHSVDGLQTLTTRQIELFKELKEQVNTITKLLVSNTPTDILVVEYQRAISLCNYLTGEDVTEEVITEVFSNFCIGK